jgi:hypothetical protein
MRRLVKAKAQKQQKQLGEKEKPTTTKKEIKGGKQSIMKWKEAATNKTGLHSL